MSSLWSEPRATSVCRRLRPREPRLCLGEPFTREPCPSARLRSKLRLGIHWLQDRQVRQATSSTQVLSS